MAKDANVYAEEMKALFKSITCNFRSLIIQHIGNHGFTVPQVMLMQELYNSPDITLIELSNKLGLAKSTVSGIVDRLVRQDVVIRTRPSDDRRTVRLSLAPKMFELQSSINIIKSNYLAEIIKDVDTQEIEEIIASLTKLNSLMNAKNKDI